ncbi:flagellar motor switch phosphatase FliY [Thermotoga petrophila]|jgi:flagellar motor switch protein FliN/FliY|uniref:flagellar motor switch phosphatase FliY n=1 Tax=Thermotoga petrophila TaxID=93929 RepID=UPI002FE1A457
MTENEFLSQEEIDKLLSGSDTDGVLTPEEKDMIGEIGNIAMGSAATTLSMILGRDIHITVPTVREEKMKNVKSDFSGEQVVVSVEYTEGLEGLNVLVLDKKLVAVIADLMMGGSGEVETEELDEIKLSAVGEAMNQMMGSAATSLSELLGITINISPPKVEILNFDDPSTQFPPVTDNPEKDVAVVEFEMEIEGLPKSKFYQVISADLVKKMYEYFTKKQSEAKGGEKKEEKKEEKKVRVEPVEFAELKPSETRKTEVPSDKLELLLDIPLRVTVELGRTRMTLKRVLEMIPGSIIELDKLTGEPVDILVNGKLIARGEVVVIDENFGVRITEIVSPKERLELLNE